MAGAQHPVVGQGPPSPSRRQVSRGPSCGQRAGPSSKGRRRNYESPSQKLVACASFWSPPKQGAPMSNTRPDRAAVAGPGESRSLRRLGDYHLVKKLGQGGMGAVFLAKRLGMGGFEKTFVVKCMLES